MLRYNHVIMNLLDAGNAGGGSGGSGDGKATGDTGAAANGGNAGNKDSGGAGGVSWDSLKASLPEELRSDSSLSTIKDVQGLVKGYVHAQKMIGKANVPIPDAKHATQEDWLQVFRKLGAPEKMDDFKFKLPDGAKEDEMDKDFLKEVKEAALSVGVMPWQFEKIFGAVHGYADKRVKEGDADYKRQHTEDVNSLKVSWGSSFDTQVKKANVALKELVPDEKDRVRLIEDGLGAHPVIMKILAGAAKYFKEDVFIGAGEGTLASITPEEALHKAKEIQGDKNHPYRRPDHPNHKAAKKEVQDLYKIAYPG